MGTERTTTLPRAARRGAPAVDLELRATADLWRDRRGEWRLVAYLLAGVAVAAAVVIVLRFGWPW